MIGYMVSMAVEQVALARTDNYPSTSLSLITEYNFAQIQF